MNVSQTLITSQSPALEIGTSAATSDVLVRTTSLDNHLTSYIGGTIDGSSVTIDVSLQPSSTVAHEQTFTVKPDPSDLTSSTESTILSYSTISSFSSYSHAQELASSLDASAVIMNYSDVMSLVSPHRDTTVLTHRPPMSSYLSFVTPWTEPASSMVHSSLSQVINHQSIVSTNLDASFTTPSSGSSSVLGTPSSSTPVIISTAAPLLPSKDVSTLQGLSPPPQSKVTISSTKESFTTVPLKPMTYSSAVPTTTIELTTRQTATAISPKHLALYIALPLSLALVILLLIILIYCCLRKKKAPVKSREETPDLWIHNNSEELALTRVDNSYSIQSDLPTTQPQETIICRVLHPYEAQAPGQLSLSKGQFVKVLEQDANGWWRGGVGDSVGWFPGTFVQELQSLESESVRETENEVHLTKIVNLPTHVQPRVSSFMLKKRSEEKSDFQRLSDIPASPAEFKASKTKVNKGKDKVNGTPDYNPENRYIVIYPYIASGEGELSISKGDNIYGLDEDSKGWMRGKKEKNGEEGWFPATYVQGITSAEEEKCAYQQLAVNRSRKSEHLVGLEHRALYPYGALCSEDLSFKPGDIIFVLETLDNGWWYGCSNGSVGWFPGKYVELVDAGSLPLSEASTLDSSFEGDYVKLRQDLTFKPSEPVKRKSKDLLPELLVSSQGSSPAGSLKRIPLRKAPVPPVQKSSSQQLLIPLQEQQPLEQQKLSLPSQPKKVLRPSRPAPAPPLATQDPNATRRLKAGPIASELANGAIKHDLQDGGDFKPVVPKRYVKPKLIKIPRTDINVNNMPPSEVVNHRLPPPRPPPPSYSPPTKSDLDCNPSIVVTAAARPSVEANSNTYRNVSAQSSDLKTTSKFPSRSNTTSGSDGASKTEKRSSKTPPEKPIRVQSIHPSTGDLKGAQVSDNSQSLDKSFENSPVIPSKLRPSVPPKPMGSPKLSKAEVDKQQRTVQDIIQEFNSVTDANPEKRRNYSIDEEPGDRHARKEQARYENVPPSQAKPQIAERPIRPPPVTQPKESTGLQLPSLGLESNYSQAGSLMTQAPGCTKTQVPTREIDKPPSFSPPPPKELSPLNIEIIQPKNAENKLKQRKVTLRKAVMSYQAQRDGELSFNEGSFIKDMKELPDRPGWCLGMLADGTTGAYLKIYVQDSVIPDESFA